MHPLFFQFGPLTVRWYGVCVALGFLAGYWLFQKRAARLGLSQTDSSNLVLMVFLSGILGARVYYVLVHWQDFKGHPVEILRVDHGGLVFHGGFVVALLALFGWARIKKLSFASLADHLAPSLALGQFLGRIGCFMNGCCYGLPCDHFWAIRLNSPPEVARQPVHPVQLYEAFGVLDIFFTLLVLERLKRYPGYVICSYGILYAVLRFFVEFFRGDVPRVLLDRFTLAQGISVAIFLVSWGISFWLSQKTARERRAALLRP